MQQTIYNSITIDNSITTQTTKTAGRHAGWGRMAQSWELIAVAALIVSSAAYGLFALATAL